MANFNLPYFGQIDLIKLEEYYNVKVRFFEKEINIDLNFESKTINELNAEKINMFLNNIGNFESVNKNLIEKNFHDEGETANYINFYFDELDEEELSDIINFDDKYNSKEHQLLNKLKLIRVGLYPDGKYGASYYGVFDYSIDIDGEPCNQILVVKTNEIGELDHITWES